MIATPTETTEAITRESWLSGKTEGWSDEALLGRFADARDPSSPECFRALVIRHGPMVLGVCRQVMGQVHDAEDAFQATFLVLARRAGSIRDRRSLRRWLYEVAYRVAVRAKVRSALRRTREKQAAEMSSVSYDPADDPPRLEFMPALHEEVNRLPEKYRTVVVLCYLEGRTNEEAAEFLRWPVGTVKGRLHKARELLRSRLVRRGLAVSAAFLATGLSRDTVHAEVVPSRLVEETTRAAADVRKTGRVRNGSVASFVAGITEDVLRKRVSHSVHSAVPALAVVVVFATFLGAHAALPGRGLDPSSGNQTGMTLSAVSETGGTGGAGVCGRSRVRDRVGSPGSAH